MLKQALAVVCERDAKGREIGTATVSPACGRNRRRGAEAYGLPACGTPKSRFRPTSASGQVPAKDGCPPDPAVKRGGLE